MTDAGLLAGDEVKVSTRRRVGIDERVFVVRRAYIVENPMKPKENTAVETIGKTGWSV